MTKFLLLSKYSSDARIQPMAEWAPQDAQAHMSFLESLNAELVERGELVDALALTGPELATIVSSDGDGVPVLTDGPFPESKEMLAGYQMIDVESKARALEIAARLSSAPGPGGAALQQPIEVRQVMGAPPGADL